jgi:prephenate dehydrogenase
LISTALAETIGTADEAARVAGPAAIDLTRLALSPYEIWRDIFLTNAANMDATLKLFIEKIEELRARLPHVEKEFETASAAARKLRTCS